MNNSYRLPSGLLLAALLVNTAQAGQATFTTTSVLGRAPSMLAPTITHTDSNNNGLVDTGDTLTAVPGAFTDQDGDAQGVATYRWNDGSTNLSTESNYTVRAADLGKTLSLYITPRTAPATTEPSTGAEQSASVVVANAQTVGSVLITGLVNGYPQVGSTLTATPSCVGGSCAGGKTYQWKLESGVATDVFTDIRGATAATYIPKAGDQRLKIRVTVN